MFEKVEALLEVLLVICFLVLFLVFISGQSSAASDICTSVFRWSKPFFVYCALR